MCAIAYRPAWWIVFWGLITSLSLNWVLPVFDHHAAEYTPFHGHVVVGAASPAEASQLLQRHAHGSGQLHDHHHALPAPDADAAAWPQPTPLVVGVSQLDGVLALVARAADVLPPPAVPLLPPMLALWLLLGAAAVIPARHPISPLKPPPRLAA